jgi:hypothetical protein
MDSAHRFVTGLLVQCRTSGPFRTTRTGSALLRTVWDNYRIGPHAAKSLPVDGFRPELTANEHGGELLRHLRFQAGLSLLGPLGGMAAWVAQQMDENQGASGLPEAATELLDSETGRRCGQVLRSYLEATLSRGEAQALLESLLCEDDSSESG